MLDLLEIVIALSAIFLGYYYYSKIQKSKDKNSLPEPFSLPLFGHMFFLGTRPYLKLTEWSKTNGKIYKLKLGPEKTVVLNDPTYIREAFNITAFSGRSDSKSFSLATEGKNGIISSDGPVWIEQRRFTLRHLRDFGFGRKTMENMIMEEVSDTIEGFRKKEGVPVLIHTQFSMAVLNSLWQIVTGKRYSHDDPKLNELLDKVTDLMKEMTVNVFAMFYPSFAELFPNVTRWKRLSDMCCYLRNFYKEQIIDHKNTYDENNPRDLIDVYLKEINKTTDEHSSFYKDVGGKNLVAVISDMFQAGSETTSSVLQWSMLYISQYQDVQTKLRAEIDSVVGSSKLPSLADRPNMPFTESLIMEILRKSSVVPMGVMHTIMSSLEFKGFQIPKGYSVLANLYGVHHDASIWGDPQNFRPERFIDENGQCVKKHDALMPFSIGKRICIGEPLARDTIFLFITSIFQRFEVVPDPAAKAANLEAKVGFLLAPQPFNVVFKEIV